MQAFAFRRGCESWINLHGTDRISGLGEGKGSRSTPRATADGTRVLFDRIEGGHGQMWSASVNGSNERPVPGMLPDVQWVPARNGAYFIDGTSRHYFLNYFDFATRKVTRVADLPGLFVLWGPHLAPEGNTVLFSGVDHSEGDIMLVDGFR